MSSRPPNMSSDEWRLSCHLKELKEHLDKAEALFNAINCDEFDLEFKAMREALKEIWSGR